MFEKFRLYQLTNGSYVIAYRPGLTSMWRIARKWSYASGPVILDYSYLGNISLALDGEQTVKEAFDLLVRWLESSKPEAPKLLKKFYSFNDLKKEVEK